MKVKQLKGFTSKNTTSMLFTFFLVLKIQLIGY